MLISVNTELEVYKDDSYLEYRNKLWDRTAILEITDEVGNTLKYNSKDFYFDFYVCRTTSETPNQSNVRIYNICKEARDAIDESSKYVTLYAGYGDSPKLLFTGSVSEVLIDKSQQDITTTIYIEDGAENYRESNINKSYPTGTNLKYILTDVAKTLNLKDYKIKDVPEDMQFVNQQVLSGDSKKYLRELCKTGGLEWHIQNGVLYINSQGGYNSNQALLLDRDHGLISSPQKTRRKKKKDTSTDPTQDKGIKAKTLLMPSIIAGTPVMINSIFANGLYTVKEVIHTGSASKNADVKDYYSEMTLLEVA